MLVGMMTTAAVCSPTAVADVENPAAISAERDLPPQLADLESEPKHGERMNKLMQKHT